MGERGDYYDQDRFKYLICVAYSQRFRIGRRSLFSEEIRVETDVLPLLTFHVSPHLTLAVQDHEPLYKKAPSPQSE